RRPLEFADIDIERRAAQVIALQRVEKGILVDDLATGDVDQHAAVLHRGKTGMVEQAHRLRRPLAADHDKIAVRQPRSAPSLPPSLPIPPAPTTQTVLPWTRSGL